MMHLAKLLYSQLFWVRVVALLFTLIAFSTASFASELQYYGRLTYWCIFCWAFSFACTLLVILGEIFGLQTRTPVIWSNLSVTVALYAALFCLSSRLFSKYFFKGDNGPPKIPNYMTVSTIFSYLAVVPYVVEVNIFRARPAEETGYMSTYRGHSKVLETFIACLIFFVLTFVPYDALPELKWCMAVYCICFIVTIVVVVLCICESPHFFSKLFPKILFIYEVLAVIMYLSVIIIWALQFYGQIEQSLASKNPASADLYKVFLIILCVLTSLNFVFYVIDLAYSAKQLYSTLFVIPYNQMVQPRAVESQSSENSIVVNVRIL